MSAYSDLILGTTGLVAYWRLNEPSGIVAEDISGTNDGVYTLGPTLDQPSALVSDPADRSVSFDGTNDTVAVLASASLDVGDTFTLEAWLKRSADATHTIMGKGTNGFKFYVTSTGRVALGKMNVSDPAYTVVGVILDTKWHHVVIAKNSTTSVRIYVDGARPVLDAHTPSTVIGNPVGGVAIGSDLGGGSYYAGLMDEAAIYNVALSDQQVTAHYQAGAVRQLNLAGVGA